MDPMVGPTTETPSLPSPSFPTASSGLTRFPSMKGVGPRRGLWSREAEEVEDDESEAEAPPPPGRTETETVEKLAGVVPVPVAAMIDGSACRRSHSIVWPSDLWPSSRVSWKTLAAHMMGMRMRRPRPSTLLWRSLDGGFLTARAPFPGGCCLCGSVPAPPLVTPLLGTSELDMFDYDGEEPSK